MTVNFQDVYAFTKPNRLKLMKSRWFFENTHEARTDRHGKKRKVFDKAQKGAKTENADSNFKDFSESPMRRNPCIPSCAAPQTG